MEFLCVHFSGAWNPRKRGTKNDGQEDCGGNGSKSDWSAKHPWESRSARVLHHHQSSGDWCTPALKHLHVVKMTLIVACSYRSWQYRWTYWNWSWSCNRRSHSLESYNTATVGSCTVAAEYLSVSESRLPGKLAAYGQSSIQITHPYLLLFLSCKQGFSVCF